jgi:hypothetical protein
MYRCRIPFVKAAALCAAAFLLTASSASAGPQYHSPPPAPPHSSAVVKQTAPARSLSVVVSVPQPAAETTTVDIVGPDGQKRNFPVEGGLASIQYRRVVLRPGEVLVINWPASK